MQKFLIVGCTSGIGLALTRLLLHQNVLVWGMGRNQTVLQKLKAEFPERFHSLKIDLRNEQQLLEQLNALAGKLNSIDVCVVAASITGENPNLDWEVEKNVLQTNVLGWAAVCNWAAHYFEVQGRGHLVGITSLAKYLASVNPAYIASKAFEGKYLDGLRLRLEPKGIWVTEVLPGFVQTPMIANRRQTFMVISAQKAAQEILKAIKQKKRRVTISKRWKLFRLILPHIPVKGLLKLPS